MGVVGIVFGWITNLPWALATFFLDLINWYRHEDLKPSSRWWFNDWPGFIFYGLVLSVLYLMAAALVGLQITVRLYVYTRPLFSFLYGYIALELWRYMQIKDYGWWDNYIEDFDQTIQGASLMYYLKLCIMADAIVASGLSAAHGNMKGWRVTYFLALHFAIRNVTSGEIIPLALVCFLLSLVELFTAWVPASTTLSKAASWAAESLNPVHFALVGYCYMNGYEAPTHMTAGWRLGSYKIFLPLYAIHRLIYPIPFSVVLFLQFATWLYQATRPPPPVAQPAAQPRPFSEALRESGGPDSLQNSADSLRSSGELNQSQELRQSGEGPAPEPSLRASAKNIGGNIRNSAKGLIPGLSDTNPQELNCVVCWTRPKTVLLLPCRHLCMCRDCAGEYDKRGLMNCPMCQKPVESVLRVYV